MAIAMSPLEVRAHSQVVTFDIPAQPVGPALVAFARQAGVRLVMSEESSGGIQANAVHGAMDRDRALAMLLEGTGYQARIENDAIRIWREYDRVQSERRGDRSSGRDAAVQLSDAIPSLEGGERPGARAREEEDIVIVGTNIRGGHAVSSPVEVYTADDISRTGATTTEQFMQKLPQNAATRSQNASISTAFSNRESVNGVDLRGLGVGTTLTLLNGRRLGLASFGQTADISIIPVSALERVEVLTDGASAIYGSDAIGGVVNFVLRRDFEGAETRFMYGGVTSGGMRHGAFSQTLGRAWRGGSGLASYEFFSASPLEVSHRDFALAAGPGYLTPVDRRHGLLLSLSHRATEQLTLAGAMAFSSRETKNFGSFLTSSNPIAHFTATNRGQSDHYFGSLSADWRIASDLVASLHVSYGASDVGSHQLGLFPMLPTANQDRRYDTQHAGLDWTAKFTGSLYELPSGNVLFALGGGVLQEEYRANLTIEGRPSGNSMHRETAYAFGEISIPLVKPGDARPLANRLELNLAGRYTQYADDYGSKLSPKIGLFWSPFSGLSFRGTYGESFRAPTLAEVDRAAAFTTLSASQTVMSAPAIVLTAFGPSSDLMPETAASETIGFDITRSDPVTFRLGATYFRIDYRDRIARGADSTIPPRTDPSAWPDVIFKPASTEDIVALLSAAPTTTNNTGINLSDPGAAAIALFENPNFWVVDVRYRNLALSEISGVDLYAELESSFGGMTAAASFNGTNVIDYRRQVSPNAPVHSVVDTVLHPVGWRWRAQGSLARGSWLVAANVNYVDEYHNPFAVGGAQAVKSWTTTDLSVRYDVGGSAGGIRLALSVQNVFDAPPPHVSLSSGEALQNPVGFDPVNANPLGRFMAFTVTKRW